MPNLNEILADAIRNRGALSGQQQTAPISSLVGILSNSKQSMPPAMAATNPMQGGGTDMNAVMSRRKQLMNELPQYNPEVRWALETSRVFMQSPSQKAEWAAIQHKLNLKEQELEQLNQAYGIK